MKRWRCALLDPPWNETGAGRVKRGADRHYALLKTREMPDVIRGSGFWTPAEHAHVWLWVTNTYLPDGLWLLKELGATYKTNSVWVKDRFGLGQYMRGQHELLLFGTIGKGQHPSVWKGNRGISTLIEAARGAHSAKPEEGFEKIEKISKGPRVEFFARTTRPGWTAWGKAIKGKKSPRLVSIDSY